MSKLFPSRRRKRKRLEATTIALKFRVDLHIDRDGKTPGRFKFLFETVLNDVAEGFSVGWKIGIIATKALAYGAGISL